MTNSYCMECGIPSRTSLIRCEGCKEIHYCINCLEQRCEDLKEAFLVGHQGYMVWDRMIGEHYRTENYKKDYSRRPIKFLKRSKFKRCLSCLVEGFDERQFRFGLMGRNNWGHLPMDMKTIPAKQHLRIFETLKGRWSVQLSILPDVERKKRCSTCRGLVSTKTGHCTKEPCYSGRVPRFINPWI
jgi:hypothetical protein